MRISDWSSDVCSSDLPKPGTCGHRAVELLRSEGRERRRFSELVRHRRRSACGCAMEQPVDKTISYALVISPAAMGLDQALRLEAAEGLRGTSGPSDGGELSERAKPGPPSPNRQLGRA